MIEMWSLAGKLAFVRRRWSRLALVAMVLAACGPPGGANSVGEPTSSPPSTLLSSSDSSSTTTPAAVGLSPEFLAWVAPIDFEESTVGWEAFGLPDQEPKYLAMADCWEDNGYGEFAGHLRDQASVNPESAVYILLVPMRRLREFGFTDEPDTWVGSIVESAGPMGIAGGVEGPLKYGPDVGLKPDDTAGIRNVGEICWPEGGWIPTRGMGLAVETFGDQWITRLGELDKEPEPARVIENIVTPCLRAIDPYFNDALDPGDWLSKAQYAPQDPQDVEGYASEMWAMPEETLLAWGQALAECMEPLEEARRPLRVAAREAWVEQWYDELIEFQAEADQQSAAP